METKSVELFEINLDKLQSSPLNSRKTFDEVKLKELAASIKEKGILNAILIRQVNGKYEIICGDRRYRAAKIAGLTSIPARVMKLNDQQALEFQVIENLQREDVHPLEEAEGYERLLKKHGYKTVDDIAVKIGKSKGYIYGRLKLCELIPENREYFYDGKFSPSVALLVARVPKDLQKEVGKEVATNEEHYGDGRAMTFEEAKEYIQDDFMLQMKEAVWDPKEKGLADKVSCLECPKRTGSQKELFVDIQGADRCTDPNCFKAKKQAYTQRKFAELKKSGKKILPMEEIDNALRYGSNYINLEDTCYQAGSQGKRPSYRGLAKKAKDADIIYAIRPDNGKLIELITKPEAARIFKKLGIKDESEQTKTKGEKVGEHKKEERIDAAKRTFCIEKINKHMDQRVKNMLILSALLNDMGGLDDSPMEDEFEDLYNLGDEKVKKLIEKTFPEKVGNIQVTEYLEFLAGKLGFSMAKDYVITKEYLEACTKEELSSLAAELRIATDVYIRGEGKKTEIVAAILKNAPKGKVPKELVK